MTRTPLLIALAATAALAGCNKENQTAASNSAENSATNVPLQLPPSIVATKIYRCADNNVVTIDYLSDNKSANVHAEKGSVTAQVVAPEPGQPMVAAGGFSVEGGPTSATAKIAVPGHPAQSCKA